MTNNSNSYCTGIYNEAGEIVLKSGTIDVAHKDTGNDTNYHAYGIYNDGTDSESTTNGLNNLFADLYKYYAIIKIMLKI